MDTDPAAMTPDQRRQEIARILAQGMLRLRQVKATSGPSQPSNNSADFSQDCLDVGAEIRPHVAERS